MDTLQTEIYIKCIYKCGTFVDTTCEPLPQK